MNMVFAYVPLFYQKIVLLTYLTDKLPNSKFHFSFKNMVRYFVTHTKCYWMLYTV